MIVLALLACFFHHNADAFRPQKPFKADISFSFAVTGAVNGTALQDRFCEGYLSYDNDFYHGYSPDVEHLYAEYIQSQAAADGMPMLSLKADPEGKLLVSFYKEGKKTDWITACYGADGTSYETSLNK